MKISWFRHSECSEKEALELVEQYRRRGRKAEKSLNRDLLTWSVSVQLLKSDKPPRPDRRWRCPLGRLSQ